MNILGNVDNGVKKAGSARPCCVVAGVRKCKACNSLLREEG